MTQERLAQIRLMRNLWQDDAVGAVLTELLVHIEELGNTIVDERRQSGDVIRRLRMQERIEQHTLRGDLRTLIEQNERAIPLFQRIAKAIEKLAAQNA